ncbi:MAG TPA: hypothetical protein VMJ10_08160 [Kofleriaceae bacterium]|nr:hypothetical protein [Kofleriaceae bacterium]
MSKLRIVLLTALIAAPAGFLAAGPLRGHPHLEKARNALNTAWDEISASQKANEGVWKDEGGHGQKAKDAIEAAKHQVEEAAEWVNGHK